MRVLSVNRKCNNVGVILTLFIMTFFTSIGFAKTEADNEIKQQILERKVAFLLKIARNVSLEKSAKSDVYRIAIYGKTDQAKELYNYAKNKSYSVGSRKVEFEWFKRIGSIKEADLLYVHNDSKESLKDLKSRSGENCIFVTEDFPYGKSSINFILNDNNDVVYVMNESELKMEQKLVTTEILSSPLRVKSSTDWKLSLQLAQAKILEQETRIQVQESEIDKNKETIKVSDSTIVGQQEVIVEKKKEIVQNQQVIQQQRTLILVISVSTLLILGLLFFVFRLNKKRKIALEESQQKTREIVASITYAQRIQKASLPSNQMLVNSLKDGFIMYNPKDIVSGDFYWLEENDDAIYFAVADCTGHGVPGALLSVLCCNFLSRAVNELQLTKPSQILDSTVVLLEEFFAKSGDHVNDGMDIVLCKLNKRSNLFEYAGANRPLYYFREGQFCEKKGDRQPIGRYEYRQPYENHAIKLSKGDSVYLFSDGIVDQFGGPNGKKYSSRRLKEFLQTIHHHDMDLQKELIQNELSGWKGKGETIDDACMLGVRIS